MVKFRFSKKGTKFEAISHMIWQCQVNVKSSERSFQIFVAFFGHSVRTLLKSTVVSLFWSCLHSCKLGLVTTMSQLMIPNSNFDDSGSYKCEATSEFFENPVSATEGDFFSLIL